MFFQNVDAIIGPDDPVIYPAPDQGARLRARHPAPGDEVRGVLVQQGIDTFCPIGPWIVTKDEIPDPHDLAMELRVNGDVRQKGNTSRMVLSMPQLVARHSPQDYSAGDILTTGTISGVAAVQPDPFEFYLRPGGRGGGRDRACGRAAQPHRVLGRGLRHASAHGRQPLPRLAAPGLGRMHRGGIGRTG